MSTRDEEKEARESLAKLIRLGARIAHRYALSKDSGYYEDELCGVAWSALARAIAGYDRGQGALASYAAVWMAREIQSALEDEQERVAREGAADDAAHPLLRAEELAGDAIDLILSVYVGEELQANGEAELLSHEAFAALHREIARLDAEDQRLVALRYFEDRSWDEVAAELGIADRTARDWDLRIRSCLREALIAWETVRPLQRGER